VVILIGGVSCSGKTLMAQTLLEKYKIPYLSIDHIKMGLIRGSKYCDFSAADPETEITEKLWPIIRGIITTNIENNQNIIIEGCYIPTGHMSDFEPEYQKQIISLYIGFSKNYLDKHFISGIIENMSAIEHKELDEYISLENFISLHAQLRESCIINQANHFEIDNDYLHEINNVYRWIDEQVEAKRLIKFID
jgi:putative acetyltransferase